MCNPTPIVFNDIRTGNYKAEVPPNEEIEFLDYCAAAMCREVPFFRADEPAPYSVVERAS